MLVSTAKMKEYTSHHLFFMLSVDIFQFTPRISYGEFVSAANIRVTFKNIQNEGQRKAIIMSCSLKYRERLLE
jgi:hypothetical protein